MDRFVGNLKHHQHQHKHPPKLSSLPSSRHPHHHSNGIPAIQITQMTIDEGTDEEMENNKWPAAAKQRSEDGQKREMERTTAEKEKEGGGECTTSSVSAAPKVETTTGNVVKKESAAHQQQSDSSALLSANKYQDRSAVNRQSTGTLNRLMLVAQALESEVDWRRRNDVNSSRIVFTLRMANIVLLLLVNLLLFTGVGQYHDRNGTRISLFLTLDKWNYMPGYAPEEVPPTFAEMRLTGQFCAASLAIFMLLSTVLLQCVHCLHVRHSKLLCIFYAFACVPVALFIFGLEMHYSACPWLDDFYQSQLLRRNFNSMEKYFDTQCGINGWALAGIFSLLSCGLFVSDGLISTFFRADDSHGNEPEKPEAV